MIILRESTYHGGSCGRPGGIVYGQGLVEVSLDRGSLRFGESNVPLHFEGTHSYRELHNYGGIIGPLQTAFSQDIYDSPLGKVIFVFRADALEGKEVFDHLLFQGLEFRTSSPQTKEWV